MEGVRWGGHNQYCITRKFSVVYWGGGKGGAHSQYCIIRKFSVVCVWEGGNYVIALSGAWEGASINIIWKVSLGRDMVDCKDCLQ